MKIFTMLFSLCLMTGVTFAKEQTRKSASSEQATGYIQPEIVCSMPEESPMKAAQNLRYTIWQQIHGFSAVSEGIAVGVGPKAKAVDHSVTKTESGYVVCVTLTP
ncbi:MAG: hypothetical protein HYW49_09585 [Deltaproteobacteria bacterium]|nr:hypothetical protein [Deltaproteobacteria bacterium]